MLAPRIAAAPRRGPKGRDDRGFFEAIRWILRMGAPWRDLPLAFGAWGRVYRRFRRWAVAGRWEAIRGMLGQGSARLSLVDSAVVKAHPHAGGALRRTGGQGRKVTRTLDREAYRQRNVIERWFGRLMGFRRIATRYDKTWRSYAAFVATAALLVAMSGWQA